MLRAVVFFVVGVVFGSVFFCDVVVGFVVVTLGVVVVGGVVLGFVVVTLGVVVVGAVAGFVVVTLGVVVGGVVLGAAVVVGGGDVAGVAAVGEELSDGFTADSAVGGCVPAVGGEVTVSGAIVTFTFAEICGVCSCFVSDVCGEVAGVTSEFGTAAMLLRASPAEFLAHPKEYPIIITLKNAAASPAISGALRVFLSLRSAGGASLPSSDFMSFCRAFFISVAVANLSLGSNAQALRMISAISGLAWRGGVSFSPLILFINAVWRSEGLNSCFSESRKGRRFLLRRR